MAARITAIIFLVLLMIGPAIGQVKFKSRFLLVAELSDGSRFRGRLVNLGDSYIEVSEEKELDLPLEEDKVMELNITNIERLKFRRGIGRGIGIGTAVGTTIGAASGFISGDDPASYISFTAADKALIYGVFLGVTGAVVGGVIATIKKKYEINGQLARYNNLRPVLIKYTMRPE